MKSKIELPKRMHVIGICGVATGALAVAFHKKGVKITGSDKGFFPPVSTELEKQGINFYAGWHPEKINAMGKPDVIMIGTASGTHNPETQMAKDENIPVYSYPEIIGKFFVKDQSIVCAGTWGKTSSSALLSFILEKAGLQPTYMFGGISLSHEASAKLTDGNISVLEGDEYKSSPIDQRAKFFHYKPTHLLLSAVSWDHADLYPTEQSYFHAFRDLLISMQQNAVVVRCADQKGIEEIIGGFKGKIVTYGRFNEMLSNRDYSYKNIIQTKNGLTFIINNAGHDYKVKSPMLGLYQAENITGCFAMASLLGVDPQNIIEAISQFRGLKRRLEKRFENKITIIDDIAHSPEKARPILQTLRSIYNDKIIAVFEPNSGGRQRESKEKYSRNFEDADIVIIPRLTKLKLSENEKEKPMEGEELRDVISQSHKNVLYIDDDQKLINYLLSNTKKGDVIAFLGSHGFRGMIEELISIFLHQQ